jgi:hypothetical protein
MQKYVKKLKINLHRIKKSHIFEIQLLTRSLKIGSTKNKKKAIFNLSSLEINSDI